jgi:RNA polymerase sigma-70 factor (ECF subfamily)
MGSESLPLSFLRSTAAEDSKTGASVDVELDLRPSDNHLMECIKKGDRDALGLLFERYAKIVFSVSVRILRNSTEAQDLVQDVFLNIHHKCHLFNSDKGSVVSWLLRITYSRAFDRREYLNIRGWSAHSEIEEIKDPAQSHSSLDVLTETVLAKQIFERSLAELTQRERTTLELFFFEGYTLREISIKLDETVVNTRHHYYRGIEKLRAALRDQRRRSLAAD